MPPLHSRWLSSSCLEPGCDVVFSERNWPRIFECLPYCPKHYPVALKREFRAEFNKWQLDEQPVFRFKILLDRLTEVEGWLIVGDSRFPKGRIHVSGFDFTKTRNGCYFKIMSPPGMWLRIYHDKPFVQTWEADSRNKALRVLLLKDWILGKRF